MSTPLSWIRFELLLRAAHEAPAVADVNLDPGIRVWRSEERRHRIALDHLIGRAVDIDAVHSLWLVVQGGLDIRSATEPDDEYLGEHVLAEIPDAVARPLKDDFGALRILADSDQRRTVAAVLCEPLAGHAIEIVAVCLVGCLDLDLVNLHAGGRVPAVVLLARNGALDGRRVGGRCALRFSR